MTVLAAPVPGEQERLGPDFNRCGELNAVALTQIVLPGLTFSVPDGANAGQMIAALQANCPGIQLMAFNANAADLVAQWVHQGWYVLAQVHCNGQAVPLPPPQPADHWITCYSDEPAIRYYQCWLAAQYTIGNLRACSHENDAHWHVLAKLPAAPAPIPAPSEEDDMANALVADSTGKLWLFQTVPYGPKRYVADPAQADRYRAEGVPNVALSQESVDRAVREADIVSGQYPVSTAQNPPPPAG